MIQANYDIGHDDIKTGWQSGPDEAGGISVRYQVRNVGKKPIKYYDLYFLPRNAAGEAVKCSVSGRGENGVRGIGPVEKGELHSKKKFENAWYNPSVTSVVLTKAEIEYMDGTVETIPGGEITPITGTVVRWIRNLKKKLSGPRK